MKTENSSSSKSAQKKPSGQKIFGTSALQVTEDDASRLVGGIVEKGFSESPQTGTVGSFSAPRPTVLPFPVARHRSHGPHWAPKRSGFSGNGDDNEDDEESENFTNFDTVAAFANAVQRKQKKSLDFSKWRDLTSDNSSVSSVPLQKEENKHLVERLQENQFSEATETTEKINRSVGAENGVQLQRMSPNDAKVQDVDMEDTNPELLEAGTNQEQKISGMDICGSPSHMENDNHLHQDVIQVNTKRHNISEPYTTSNVGDEQGGSSLESQIDAENRAQLNRMSADEIAEAQAELMNKMSPELIQLLKTRGQEKLKKSTNVAASGQGAKLQDKDKISVNASTLSESDMSYKLTAVDSTDTEMEVDNSDGQKLTPHSGSLWDSWSKRVEAVRGLRFSLDGNVIDSDFAQVPKTGNASAQSGYSADNVSERDFLRTEGNPAAIGYTIVEALALVRSVIPGQRSLALHLISSVLDIALRHICQNQLDSILKYTNTDRLIDWEAIWAFTLGPEPELALSLRMTLDDNHNSVVLACAKVIQCVLSCDINESFFDISEKIPIYQKDLYTAPIFRSRPKMDDGFLHGGFWKYNTKPSNILPFGEGTADDKTEAEHTIKDDIAVAGQDFAAGLVRMGILARIRYLLETGPSEVLEECMLSILVAIARHSPTCADAIIKCPRLVHIVVNRFTMKDQMEINLSKIKSVTLLKVLARSEKKICIEFAKGGVFQKVTWHLYRYAFSLDHWVESGREKCKLSSDLLVEQLRLWKVCIQYGFCVSYFADLFPALCIWLTAPTFEKLIENNILSEFAAVSKEAYLVLEALSRRLPSFYLSTNPGGSTVEATSENSESWCWSHVGPMVDLGLEWLALKRDSYLSQFLYWKKLDKSNLIIQDSTLGSLLWVISAVTHMLSSVLRSVIPVNASCGEHVPYLPHFVPKIGLEIIKNRFLSFTWDNGMEYGKDPAQGGSFFEYLCLLRHQSGPETSLASVSCLHGLVEVVVSVNTLIGLTNSEVHSPPSKRLPLSRDDKILSEGILKSSLVEIRTLLNTFMKLVPSEMHHVPSIEMFARGGPAPGVGVGWGAPGGGFWSTTTLLAQMDVALLIQLLEIGPILSVKDQPTYEEVTFMMQIVNCALDICLILGPRDRVLLDKVLDLLLQVPVLKSLTLYIRRFLYLQKGFKLFGWDYTEEDYRLFSNILACHFRNRWLCVKKKKGKGENVHVGDKTVKENFPLATIDEELDTSNLTNQEHNLTSLVVEWAHQRMPLPMHWFLSPISTIDYSKVNDMQVTTDFLEVAKAGLFFLLGIEAMSALISSEIHSSIQSVPIVWKLHSLSVVLFVGMGVLEEEKSRDMYENLQELYGQLLDKSRSPKTRDKFNVEFLKFKADVHESYLTFIETIVEQFAAVSYGDLVYGRQVSMYLHRCVEASVRLAAWNALSNVRALELLPPLEKCIADGEGYLEPVEDNESILEAFVKSWVTGALDRAAARGSVSFTLVLHHLSSFIFGNCTDDKVSLQNKLAKSLLRDYTRKPKHEGMLMDLIRYNNKAASCPKPREEVEERFKLLKEACEGNSSLLSQVEKLQSSLTKEQHAL
ncbi:hypothetical protein LguiA_027700 [Lonicera macranthoides]